MSTSHLTKKDLKNDPLAHEVEVGVKYVTSHRGMLTKAAIGIGVLLIGAAGYMYYSSGQSAARQKALFEARRVMVAIVGGPVTPPALGFPNEEEKEKAVTAAYNKLAADYPGSNEASIAKLYLGAAKADKGELDAAATEYREVLSKGSEPFVSTAKLSLAQILWSQGKTDEATKLIQEIIARPTEFVSSEQASLTLGRLQATTNPEEARKTLEPLIKSRSNISTVALEIIGQLPLATAN
jgi:predicted negative regulator of RcsB-dependent stress response